MKKYTVDYFIKKFKAIPRSRWIEGTYTDGEGRYCALGHCGRKDDETAMTFEAVSLNVLLNSKAADVNDGFRTKYKQKTPKGRILAALRDVKRGWYD